MDTEKSQYDDVGRKVIVIERDSGIGWAVAFIVLAIAIGFGVIFFMDQQSMIEYKIEKAVLKLQNENVAKGGVLDLQLPSRAGLFNPNEALWTGGEVKSNAGEPSRSASIGGAVTR